VVRVPGEHALPDLTDQPVNHAGRGRDPVTSGTIPDHTARAFQAQPDGEQPVHDEAHQLRHRVRLGRWLRRPRHILTVRVGHEHHLRIESYTALAVASPGQLTATDKLVFPSFAVAEGLVCLSDGREGGGVRGLPVTA